MCLTLRSSLALLEAAKISIHPSGSEVAQFNLVASRLATIPHSLELAIQPNEALAGPLKALLTCASNNNATLNKR